MTDRDKDVSAQQETGMIAPQGTPESRARRIWPDIAADLGLEVADVRFRPLRINSRHLDRRCALEVRLAEHRRYVLRADFADAQREVFRDHLALHRRLSEGLENDPLVSLPRLLWQDPEQAIALFEFFRGETAYRELDLCDYGLGARSDILRRIGAATARLHHVGGAEERGFFPKHLLGRVRRRAEQVRSRAIVVQKPKMFLGLCALIHRFGRVARGAPYLAALEHGDLHARNILIRGDHIAFIDISNARNMNPMRDLANFWLANCPHLQAPDGVDVGFGNVAHSDWAAFEEGYGWPFAADPVFRFLYAIRLQEGWFRLSTVNWDRASDREAQLAGMVATFKALKNDDPG